MTLHEAVGVLNTARHRGGDGWETHLAADNSWWALRRSRDGNLTTTGFIPDWLGEFEAIAVAEKYIVPNALSIIEERLDRLEAHVGISGDFEPK